MNTSIVAQTSSKHVVSSFSLAFTLGVEDAKAGELCVPEMYFTHPDDMADYAAGHESIKGVSATTAHFTGSALPKVAPVAPAAKGTRRPRTENATYQRIIEAAEAHNKAIDAMLAKTAAFSPDLDGDIIFA